MGIRVKKGQNPLRAQAARGFDVFKNIPAGCKGLKPSSCGNAFSDWAKTCPCGSYAAVVFSFCTGASFFM
jgi:hypothetical protein